MNHPLVRRALIHMLATMVCMGGLSFGISQWILGGSHWLLALAFLCAVGDAINDALKPAWLA